MRSLAIPKPTTLGGVNVTHLEQLAQLHPESNIGASPKFDSGFEVVDNDGLTETTCNILGQMAITANVDPEQIDRVYIDTRSAQPGKLQRQHRPYWHYDVGEHVSASTTLPTVFVYGRIRYRDLGAFTYKSAQLKLQQQLSDCSNPQELGLGVFQAKENQWTKFDVRHPHRGIINDTGKPVRRIWVAFSQRP